MKKSISCGMLFIGIATGLLGCAAEGLPTDEEMMAEETGLEIVADPGDSIGLESSAIEDTSAEDFALMAAAENGFNESGELSTSPGLYDRRPTTSAATDCPGTCPGVCKTYHGQCSGWGGYMSSASCEGFTNTVYGGSKYAWITICGPCGARTVAGAGEGYCWW